MTRRTVTITEAVVIVRLDDGEHHQVALSDDDRDALLSFLETRHGGCINVAARPMRDFEIVREEEARHGLSQEKGASRL
jgi:hypothetical protein